MIAFPAGVKVWLAGGVTDMRRGMNSLALMVQQGLGRDPHGGELFLLPRRARIADQDPLARRGWVCRCT
jgi:transposase